MSSRPEKFTSETNSFYWTQTGNLNLILTVVVWLCITGRAENYMTTWHGVATNPAHVTDFVFTILFFVHKAASCNMLNLHISIILWHVTTMTALFYKRKRKPVFSDFIHTGIWLRIAATHLHTALPHIYYVYS